MLSSALSLPLSLVFLWLVLLLVSNVRVLVNSDMCDVVMSFVIESVRCSLLGLMFSLSLLSSFSLCPLSSIYKRRNIIYIHLEAGPFGELRPKRPVLNWIYNTSK